MNLSNANGVLASQHLLDAIDEGIIFSNWTIREENIQPASLDLRLGEVAYRIQCSFLPGNETVERRRKDFTIDEIPLDRDGVVLEPHRPYLIPLKEELELPDDLSGLTNPKSSTGRLDVFTRVITDGSSRFDEIRRGYAGRMYLEVVPLSFPIRVREDLTLNQLRLTRGRPTLTDDEIVDLHNRTPLLYRRDGSPVPAAELALSNGLFLRLDLSPHDALDPVGYRAKDTAPLLDLTSSSPINPNQFWEAIYSDGDHIILKPERFYLLMSEEAVSIPPSVASEMTAYDPTSGELRTHYAGFFDPGFGFSPAGNFFGSRAALEVRAHDVEFLVEHRQHICKLTFEHMMDPPLTLYGQSGRSSYQRQERALGKHFLQPSLPNKEKQELREAPVEVDPRQRVLFED